VSSSQPLPSAHPLSVAQASLFWDSMHSHEPNGTIFKYGNQTSYWAVPRLCVPYDYGLWNTDTICCIHLVGSNLYQPKLCLCPTALCHMWFVPNIYECYNQVLLHFPCIFVVVPELTKRHSMRRVAGDCRYLRILNPGSRLNWVGSFTPRSHYRCGKNGGTSQIVWVPQ
jgi:hypothetical protein